MIKELPCKETMRFEGETKITRYCLLDQGHDGPHEYYKIPIMWAISLFIKECLWHRWVPSTFRGNS